MSAHEHAPLSAREAGELARIEDRLRRDGVRISAFAIRPAWPYQLAGVVLVAAGASTMVGGRSAAQPAMLWIYLVLGATAMLLGGVLAVDVVRRAIGRTVAGSWWRLCRWWTSRRRDRHDPSIQRSAR